MHITGARISVSVSVVVSFLDGRFLLLTSLAWSVARVDGDDLMMISANGISSTHAQPMPSPPVDLELYYDVHLCS